MIVILDTNIFIYDSHLLRGDVGQQLLRFLRAKSGQLFLPEVLHEEYVKHARKLAREYQDEMNRSAGKLRALTGQGIRHDVLSDETIDRTTVDRLKELEPITRIGPTKDDLYKSTGQRVTAERPPTTKTDHGFKDCMIWEGVLTLPAGSNVRVVTHDKGFWEKDEFSAVLIGEARDRDIQVRGYKRLEQLVQELQADTPELNFTDATVTETLQSRVELEAVELQRPLEPALPKQRGAGTTGREFDEALSRVHESFKGNDGKVLGFIAFLESEGKAQLFALLSQAGITTEVARNAAERLSLAGVVRDIGNHYLIEDRNLARAASATVEQEIIELLGRGG